MNPLILVFGIFIIHWLADFVLQTHWQAINKSSNNKALINHTAVYAACWYLPALLTFFDMPKAFMFFAATFSIHTIQDYFTSRWDKYYFDKKNFHNGFVVIGLDQILHYTQLIGTYYLLK